MPFVFLNVDPRDVSAGKDLAWAFDRSGEAVARAGSDDRVVKVRGNEVGDSDAVDGIRILVVFAWIAGFYKVAILACAVLDFSPDDLDGDRGLHAIAVGVNEHFEYLVAGVNRPGRIGLRGNDLGIRLLVLVSVKAAFTGRKGLDKLNGPDTGGDFLGAGKVHDSRRDRP